MGLPMVQGSNNETEEQQHEGFKMSDNCRHGIDMSRACQDCSAVSDNAKGEAQSPAKNL